MLSVEQAIKAARLFPEKRKTMPILGTISVNGRVEATDLETWYSAVVSNSALNGCYEIADLALYPTVTPRPARKLEEFPTRPDHGVKPSNRLELGQLLSELERCLPFASDDPTRYNINGLYFETDRIVATDGHSLIVSEIPHGLDNVILSKDGCKKLAKWLKMRRLTEGKDAGVHISWNDALVTFNLPATGETVTLRKVDGQYPDYRQVIPADSFQVVALGLQQKNCKLDTSSLVKVSKRTNDSRDPAIKLTKDQAGVTYKSPAIPQYVVCPSEPAPFTIGFSARLLSRCLDAIQSRELLLTSEYGPAIIRNGRIQAIIMPMRFE